MCAAPCSRRLSVALIVALAVVFGSLPRGDRARRDVYRHYDDGRAAYDAAGWQLHLDAGRQSMYAARGGAGREFTRWIESDHSTRWNLRLTVTGPGQDAAAGDLNITAGSLTIVGADARTTIIDGNHTDRIFFVQLGASANIANVLMRNGITTNPPLPPRPAGILNNGTITLTNVTMRDNSATTRVSRLVARLRATEPRPLIT